MKRIQKNALWIAMFILGFVIILLWTMEDIGRGDIIASCFILVAIALIFIGQVNLSYTKEKLNSIPMEFVKHFNKLHDKERNDVVWFMERVNSLSKRVEEEIVFFSVANAALEKAKKNNEEISISSLESEKQKAAKKLNATNDEFEAVRKKMLFS